MTPQQGQIKIAEACGWKWFNFKGSKVEPEKDWYQFLKPHEWIERHGGVVCERPENWENEDFSSVPDYCNSIDAIREAVLAQDGDFQRDFQAQLYAKSGGAWSHTFFHEFTAADWCAAFLAVLESRKPSLGKTLYPIGATAGQEETK